MLYFDNFCPDLQRFRQSSEPHLLELMLREEQHTGHDNAYPRSPRICVQYG